MIHKLKHLNLNTRCDTHFTLLFIFLICLCFASFTLFAKTINVPPGKGTLQQAINSAHKNDIILLTEGVYSGSININRSLSIEGKDKSVIDGENTSHVVIIDAPNVLIKNLQILNSGKDLNGEDSAIFITRRGDNAKVLENYLENNLIGIFLKGPDSAFISNNTIIGSQFHRMNDRGNGIYLWNTPGSVIENNTIKYGRDGIFVTNSKNNIFRNNHLSHLRFAIHYMYTHDSNIENNVSLNNHVGFALMFSDRIHAQGNQSIGDKERGLFFNFTNYSHIEGNRVSGGAKKCVFIYNANFNTINNNHFEGCQIGIHFTAGSKNNDVYSNAFINNRTQVKYVGTRYIEWSKNGVGNYWSDNDAFDINGDGISDQAYRPNDLVDQIIWRHPVAKLLLNSPSVKLLKWAQTEFPGIHPGGVTDSVPLMKPPRLDIKIPGDLVND